MRTWARDVMRIEVVKMNYNCEQCDKPAAVILARRIHGFSDSGTTVTDPEAPLHPRCGDHLAPGDAWLIDALTPKVERFWARKAAHDH